MSTLIAKITLNLSMILYLIHYIPQLWHNQKAQQLSGLSSYFHGLLFLGGLTDLIYGFGLSMPWQYKLVSFSSVSCLFIQHCQLKKIISRIHFIKITLVLVCIFFAGISLFFINEKNKLPFELFGYLSQACAITCTFPQIIKNMLSLSAMSLSLFYLILDLICSVCDNISAAILAWPLPSKLGALFSVLTCVFLIYQRIKVTSKK